MRRGVRPVRQLGALTIWLSVAAAGCAASFAGGMYLQGLRWRAADAARLELEREARRGQEKQADGAAVRHEGTRAALRAQQQIITREVERVVEVPLYRDVCLDADGLRLVAAAAGAASGAGQPAPAVSASAASR